MKKKNSAPVWKDTKRWLGMPITLTRYCVNSISMTITTGLFSKDEESYKLHLVERINCSISFFQWMFGVGTVKVYLRNKDGSEKCVRLINIANPRDVRDQIEEVSEEAIMRHRHSYWNLPPVDEDPDQRPRGRADRK